MIADLVPVHDVDRVWPMISERIIACIDDTDADCSAGEMWSLLRAGHLFLIIVHEDGTIVGATVWKAETWVKGPVLKNIIVVGDGMKSWIEIIKTAASDLARLCGARAYVWQGSRAWSRHFPEAKMTCNYIMEVPER